MAVLALKGGSFSFMSRPSDRPQLLVGAVEIRRSRTGEMEIPSELLLLETAGLASRGKRRSAPVEDPRVIEGIAGLDVVELFLGTAVESSFSASWFVDLRTRSSGFSLEE